MKFGLHEIWPGQAKARLACLGIVLQFAIVGVRLPGAFAELAQ
jgi:hypothetical protein